MCTVRNFELLTKKKKKKPRKCNAIRFSQQVTLIITNKSVYIAYKVSRNQIRPRLKRHLQSTLRRLRQQFRWRHARRLKTCTICNVRHRHIQAMNGTKAKNNLNWLQTKYPLEKKLLTETVNDLPSIMRSVKDTRQTLQNILETASFQ
jgi:hypothetical protein